MAMPALGVVASDVVGFGVVLVMVAIAVVGLASAVREGRSAERVQNLEDSYQAATELKRIRNNLEVARMRGELKRDASSLRDDLEDDLL
jgi:hypothetical protein